MPSVSRIVRADPRGAITRPEQEMPVLATIRWPHGRTKEVLAIATAWTRNAVQVSWEIEIGRGFRADWIPADDVRWSASPTIPADGPPNIHVGRPRTYW